MNKKKQSKRLQAVHEVWIGMDWGDEEHAVSIVSLQGDLLEQFRIPNSPVGYRALDERMTRYATVRGVAVEATRHPLLLHLKERGVTLYLINPKMSKAWRATDSVSGAKSDDRDGLSLACNLAFRHAKLRPVSPEDAALGRLALLCEKESHLIGQRTALVQELQSLLKLYYPGALQFFEDWTAPAAWDFLKRFPTAAALARAQSSTVIAFLKGHRLGYSAHWKEKVETRGAAREWPTHPYESVYQLQMQCIIGQLYVIKGTLRQMRGDIETVFAAIPQAEVVASLPGAGPKLAPRLTAIVGSPEAREGGMQALRAHAGIAPLLWESGKHKEVRIRRMCNKTWRNTMHLFAWCSTRFSRWAAAFYHYRKARGDTHSTALRKLADKWLKILLRMLATGQPYDEAQYVQSLRRTNSPTWQYMNKSTCG